MCACARDPHGRDSGGGGHGLAKKKRKTVRKEVRESLIEQVESKGADIALFSDQVEDYMAFWDQKEMLRDAAAATQQLLAEMDPEPGENRAMFMKMKLDAGRQLLDANKQMIATNRQMLSLLKALDVSTGNIVKAGEDVDKL